MFIDFEALKKAVSFEAAIGRLGLEVKQSGNQWRGMCPGCGSEDPRALVITEGKGFFCFSAKKGGDVLALAAHVRDCSVKEAAQFLAGTVDAGTRKVPSTSSQEPRQPQPAPQEDNRLEKVAARLLHEHPEVQALGLTPEKAEELGIGYDKRGVLRGRVLIPLYKDGDIAGFVGFAKDLEPVLKFPSQLIEESATNVVPIAKKKA